MLTEVMECRTAVLDSLSWGAGKPKVQSEIAIKRHTQANNYKGFFFSSYIRGSYKGDTQKFQSSTITSYHK